MTLSVVIPVFDQAKYLGDAIQSVLDQTVKPDEIIVVNDGSTDTSGEVAKSFDVKVINQVNKGLPSARNTGIMNATSDYILFLDADDMLLDHCVERIMQAIEAEGTDVIAPSFKSFGTQNGEAVLQTLPTLQDFATGNRLPYFCAVKRSVLLEIGGYSPRMLWGWEDYALWMDIFSRNKTLTMIPEVLVLYRTKENSMIHEANRHSTELGAQLRKDFPQVYV